MTDILNSLMIIQHPKWNLWNEKNVTKHISWLLQNIYNYTYEDFRKKLYLNVVERPEIELKNEDNIPILQYWKQLEDIYWNKLMKYENRYKYIS